MILPRTFSKIKLWNLSMVIAIQEKVYQEICKVVGKDGKPVTMEHINQLVYLDQCMNETFRLFPSIPWIARRTTKDVTLKGRIFHPPRRNSEITNWRRLSPPDGRFLPAGCDVILAIIGIHRSPTIYEDPKAWKPDRFLPADVAKRHPCSYVPFSVGARNCLGRYTRYPTEPVSLHKE